MSAAHRLPRSRLLSRSLRYSGHAAFWFTVGILGSVAVLAAGWGVTDLVLRIAAMFGVHHH